MVWEVRRSVKTAVRWTSFKTGNAGSRDSRGVFDLAIWRVAAQLFGSRMTASCSGTHCKHSWTLVRIRSGAVSICLSRSQTTRSTNRKDRLCGVNGTLQSSQSDSPQTSVAPTTARAPATAEISPQRCVFLVALLSIFYCWVDVETRTFRQRPLLLQTSRSSRSSNETSLSTTNGSQRLMGM